MEIDFDIEAAFKMLSGGKETMDKMLKQLELLSYMPLPNSKGASGIADSDGKALLDFGSPNLGRIWNVVGITVVKDSDHTAVANSQVAVYIGNPANPSFANLILPGNDKTVPFYWQWNKDQLFVQAQDHLFAIAYGLTEDDAASGNIRVLDYNRSTRWAGI